MNDLENIPQINGVPLKFKVMNLRLSEAAPMEFYETLANTKSSVDFERFCKNKETLLSPEAPLGERKLLLAQLALSDNVEAMRALESYAETCPDDVREFAQMAVYHSKLFLEAAILGEDQIVVAGGLGGEDQKMRFFVALMSHKRKPFTDMQQQVVKKEVAYQLKQGGATMESITFEGGYAKIVALVPMNANMRMLLQQSIDECNELGNFMERNMIISNVEVLSNERLDEIVGQVR